MSTLDPLLPLLPPPVVSLIRTLDAFTPDLSFKLLLTIFVIAAANFLFNIFKSSHASPLTDDHEVLSSLSSGACVLIGPPSSGKTLLYMSLLSPTSTTNISTLTSMVLSTDTLTLSSNAFISLIDHPGHPRLQASLPPTLSHTSLLIFTLDSSAPATFPAAARLLYDAATSKEFGAVKHALIACTHSNKPLAKSAVRIKTALNMELERLRKTDLTLTSTGEESGNRSILAVAGAKIELDKDLGVAVTFVSIDVTQKEGVETVRDWIQAKQKTL